MTSPVCTPTPLFPSVPLTTNAVSLPQRIRTLLGSLPTPNRSGERRREPRFPFPYLIRLTPVDVDGWTPLPTSLVVVGKHISEHGIGFFHPTPLPYRRVVATLSTGDRWTTVNVLVDLTWCRFTREGWYDGGGRFLGEVVLPPSATPPQNA